jgi:hypothetical protein
MWRCMGCDFDTYFNFFNFCVSAYFSWNFNWSLSHSQRNTPRENWSPKLVCIFGIHSIWTNSSFWQCPCIKNKFTHCPATVFHLLVLSLHSIYICYIHNNVPTTIKQINKKITLFMGLESRFINKNRKKVNYKLYWPMTHFKNLCLDINICMYVCTEIFTSHHINKPRAWGFVRQLSHEDPCARTFGSGYCCVKGYLQKHPIEFLLHNLIKKILNLSFST